jgi:hypothetical protein
VASRRAQVDPAAFQSTIPSKPGRHCPIKPAAAAVSEGQPENSTETHGPCQFSEYPISSQSYPCGRLCGASDPFRPGSTQIRREVSANWKTSRDRAGNLTRRQIIIGEVSRIQSGSLENPAGFVQARPPTAKRGRALTPLTFPARRFLGPINPAAAAVSEVGLETSMETPRPCQFSPKIGNQKLPSGIISAP